MQTLTSRHVIDEETKVFSKNPLCNPPSQNDPLVNKFGVQEYQKDPPNLIYPLYLNPPSFSSQQTSPSLIFTSYPDPTVSTKLQFPINGFF